MSTMKTEHRTVTEMALEHRNGRGRRATDRSDWVPFILFGAAMLMLGVLIGVTLAH